MPIRPEADGVRSRSFVRTEVNGRENNEDAFHVFGLLSAPELPPVVVLALADGMGGLAHGEHASREGLRRFSLALFERLGIEPTLNCAEPARPPDAESLGRALWNAVEQASAHIRRMVQTNRWGKAGSTLVAAALLGDQAIVVNLGDSPLFHYLAASRQLIQVTRDHTVAGALVRAGLITAEMARHHEGKGRLEFFLGVENLPREPQLHTVALAAGDVLLLCSDGAIGSLAPAEIADALDNPADHLDRMADRLLERSRAAGETDNQTVILWRHGTHPPAPLPAKTVAATERQPPTEAPSVPLPVVEPGAAPGHAPPTGPPVGLLQRIRQTFSRGTLLLS